MQARAGRGDPARVRVGSVETALLSVGAKAAVDRQRETRLAVRRGRQPIEGERDVGSHRPAHPIGQRPVVASARRRARERERGADAGGELRARARAHLEPMGARAPRHLDRVASAHGYGDPGGREREHGKAHVKRAHGDAVAPPASNGRRARDGEVAPPREMMRVGDPGGQHARLEQARVHLAHRVPGGDGREVGRALMSSLDAERLTEGREHERAGD